MATAIHRITGVGGAGVVVVAVDRREHAADCRIARINSACIVVIAGIHDTGRLGTTSDRIAHNGIGIAGGTAETIINQ
jgi:hypothetical protein